VVRRNAAKMDGRTLELANAHELGEDSVIEQTATAFEEGRPGVLFTAARPSRLPVPEMPDEELRELLAEVYAGAPWVDLDRLVREVRDPDVPFEESLRFFFNLPAQGLLAAVSPTLWAERKRTRELREGETIALGFDGSRRQDGTALVACTADGWLAPGEIIERPAGMENWRVDRSIIHRALEYLFATYEVAFLFADPWKWIDELEEWARRWPEQVIEFPTNTRRMPPAVDRFRTALAEGRVTHDGDHDLTRHVLNARLRKVGRTDEGRGAYILEKPGPGRLIDAAVASVLAYEASRLIDENQPELMVAWA
jgi:phage terminase large subunit-like protein